MTFKIIPNQLFVLKKIQLFDIFITLGRFLNWLMLQYSISLDICALKQVGGEIIWFGASVGKLCGAQHSSFSPIPRNTLICVLFYFLRPIKSYPFLFGTEINLFQKNLRFHWTKKNIRWVSPHAHCDIYILGQLFGWLQKMSP